MTAAFKPAYLIHGDDHVRIAQRRTRLRALAESQDDASGAEVFEGEASTPEALGLALHAMTFATGRRVLIADGVERWKEKEVAAHLTAILASMPPETTVAFFAREEGRAKAPAALHKAVKAAGGTIEAETAVKPWELPKWVVRHARRVDLELDQDAARALVSQVGDRQPRLMRELETLALDVGGGTVVTAEMIEERSADSSERKVWALADALVARDRRAAIAIFLELRDQGERVAGMAYWMTTRVRQALDVVCRLDAGQSPGDIKGTLRMPPKAADRLIADARGADVASLRRALCGLADLEVAGRGGSGADEDTAALRTIGRIAR